MVALAQRPTSAHPSRQGTQAWASSSADASKAYHATGEWGKRGMTLQELTRAFDAFNEHEERMAIGFAWSEDCSRKLEEPLSGVKTVFSDLDGLRPLFPLPESPSSPSSSSSTTPISSYQPSTLRPNSYVKTTDELGCVARASEADDPRGSSNPSQIGVYAIEGGGARVDEDTIKPAHKRRRSLSAVSPPQTPPASDEEPTYDFRRDESAGTEELPTRPPSRLGFFDREEEIGYERGRTHDVISLERVSNRGKLREDTTYCI